MSHHIDTFCNLAGGTFDCPLTKQPRQLLIRSFVRPGIILTLIPEPDNPYGDHAVAVHMIREEMTRDKTYHLGYIPDTQSKKIFKALQKGATIQAKVTKLTGGTRQKPTFGVNLKLESI